ncbi:leucine-rich repeat, cysteine-containing subtype protein [Tanacetum coccineum]
MIQRSLGFDSYVISITIVTGGGGSPLQFLSSWISRNPEAKGSTESVLDYVVPCIHDGDDLNSISLVSHKFYELDCITLKHLNVHLFYASNLSTLSKRFPFIESLTHKGLPYSDVLSQILATPWIKEISVKFDCLKALYIRRFSEKGLLHIAQYCNDLRSLCLEDNGVEDDNELVGKANGECYLGLISNIVQRPRFEISIIACPNLEVLCTDDVCGDMGLRVIGRFCKKLRKLTHHGDLTQMGLIALVQGCTNLEYLDVTLLDISNEAFECVGTHLKNICDFHMHLYNKGIDLPLDNGIRAMLKGCIKLKRLTLFLHDEELTDVGLLKLSKGSPRLRKLYFWNCPFGDQAIATFVFNIQSLRYVWVKDYLDTVLALTRPTFNAKVLTELTPYVTLAEKLHKLAVQLVANGSGLGSVKITYTFSRATDNLDTPLVRAMLAKGICVNGEQVIVDGSSGKPLEIIRVQIANTSILDEEENVNITSLSFGRIQQYNILVIGVDEKPSKKDLNKIDKIFAVFLAF